jgi:hypothetical protein
MSNIGTFYPLASNALLSGKMRAKASLFSDAATCYTLVSLVALKTNTTINKCTKFKLARTKLNQNY